MDARTPAWAAAWVLSLVPLAWPGAAERLAGSSRMALAILPWLALAGLPRRALDAPVDESARGDSKWVPVALALPAVALGLRLDVDSGFGQRERLLVAQSSLVLAWVLASAARRAARSRRAHARHAIAWLALVPGVPLLAVALKAGGAPLLGEPPRLVAVIAEASPLAWLWHRVDAPGDWHIAAPVLACVAVWLSSLGLRAGDEADA